MKSDTRTVAFRVSPSSQHIRPGETNYVLVCGTSAGPGSLPRSLLLRDPRSNLLVENIERQRTLSQHRIVEFADVEFRAQLAFRALAQLENLHLAELVGQRLPGPRDIAVNLAGDVGIVHGRVRVEVVDHLLARPVLAVHAGIDHQP